MVEEPVTKRHLPQRSLISLGLNPNQASFQFLRKLNCRLAMTPLSKASLFIVLAFVSLFSTVLSESDYPTIQLPSSGQPCADSLPSSCPVKCFRADPVCGVDGITYWCGCADALCAGTKVAKLGFCEVGNGGSAPLSGQALLLVHIVWLIVLGFSVLLGVF